MKNTRHYRQAIAWLLAVTLAAAFVRAQPPAVEPNAAEAQPSEADARCPLEWDYLTGNWFGARDTLVEHGIDLQGSIIMDWSRNFQGGLRTNGSTFRHLVDVNLTLDMEKLVGLKGGTFFIDFYNQNGPDSSTVDTGDWQAYSNIDADGLTQIAELWYRQDLFDGLLGIKFGKIEANSDFAWVEYGLEFLNSSAAITPTILDMPTYPDPATGVVLFINPIEHIYANVGLFDGAIQEGVRTGPRGPSTFFGSPADLFVIGEAGLTWDCGGHPGRVAVGAWGHTGTFDAFAGGTRHGTEGWYALLDQLLLRENAEDEENMQGLGVFAQIGCADDDVAEVDWHVGGGATYLGLIPTRDADRVGLMASYVHFGDAARDAGVFVEDYELAIETFYKCQLTPWFSLKPDLQYIVNPGGSADLKDAVVGTLRVEVVF